MIEIKNVTKEYSLSKKQQQEIGVQSNTVRAVNDVSFECSAGRVFSLLGPNGAGKTTLLRIIATILKPSAGDIRVCGFSVRTHPEDVRRNIGFLTGSTGLYERLTPNEVIRYFADLNGMSPQDFTRRKDYLFDLLNIHEFANKQVGKLSTGMKQRVSIARTVIHDPAVVIFDEPTSGLDIISAENIIKLIRDCRNEGKTVIFSSHIMSEVDLLCDDLAIIGKGKLLYNDTMQQFRNNMQTANLTEEFIRIATQKN